MYEPRQITNTQTARTIKCVALNPTNNAQGGYKFLTLNTGKIVTRNQWVELPVPDEVIREVEALGKQQKQPNVDKHGYYFLWSKLRSFSNLELSSAIIHLPDESANTIEEADAQQTPTDIPDTLPEPEGADNMTQIVPFNQPLTSNAATTIKMATTNDEDQGAEDSETTNDEEQGAEDSETESIEDDNALMSDSSAPKKPSISDPNVCKESNPEAWRCSNQSHH